MAPIPQNKKDMPDLIKSVLDNFSLQSEWDKNRGHILSLQGFDQSFTLSAKEQKVTNISQTTINSKRVMPLTTSADQNVHDVDVFFHATYFTGIGGMNVSADLFSLFIPRSVANRFNFDATNDVEISKSLYLCDKMGESILKCSLPKKYKGMQALIDAVDADLKDKLDSGDWASISTYKSSDGRTGGLAFLRDLIRSHIDSAPGLSDIQKAKSRRSVANLTDPDKCPFEWHAWADIGHVPNPGDLASGPSDAATRSRRDKVEEEGMASNTSVTIKEANLVGQLGLVKSDKKLLPKICSVYYNANYWNSGQGLSILLDEVRAHSITVNGAFLSVAPDARYSSLPLDTYVKNLNSASGEYGNGTDYKSSIQTALAELNAIRDGLTALCTQVESYARKKKPTGTLTDADINDAFSDLCKTDAQFLNTVENLHTQHTALTSKYATARLYGPGGNNYGKTDKKNHVITPMSWARGIFSKDNALPGEDVAGYMALDYATNYIARGIDLTISGERKLQVIDYVVDEKTSRVDVPKGSNTGTARVMLQIRVDKKQSLVEEDEDDMKDLITSALAPVLKETGAKMDANAGISVSENDAYRIYSVPILSEFRASTEDEVNQLKILIHLPATLYTSSLERNPALELTASVTDFHIPGTTITNTPPNYFSFALEVGMSHTNPAGRIIKLMKGNVFEPQRDVSSGDYYDEFKLFGYDPLINWMNDRIRTYFYDVRKNPFGWVGSGLFTGDLATYHSTVNFGLGFQTYMTASKAVFDSKLDGYLTVGMGDPVRAYAPKDPKMKDVKMDFLDGISKIAEWSPLEAQLAYWEAYKGWLMQSKNYVDPHMLVLNDDGKTDFGAQLTAKSLTVTPFDLGRIKGLSNGSNLELKIGTNTYRFERNAAGTLGVYDVSGQAILDGLTEAITTASAHYTATPLIEFAPTYLKGVRLQGDIIETYDRYFQACKEQGITALFDFNLFGQPNELSITLSGGIGPTNNQYLTQNIAHPESSLGFKLTNTNALLIDWYFNVKKWGTEEDQSWARLDLHTRFTIMMIEGYRHYEYDAEAQKAWTNPLAGTPGHENEPKGILDLLNDAGGNPDMLVLNDFKAAADRLKAKLKTDDSTGRNLCDKIYDLCDPYKQKPTDWAAQISGAFAGSGDPNDPDRNLGLIDILNSEMYLGGDVSMSGMVGGMHTNPQDTFISKDRFPFGPSFPSGLLSLEYRLHQTNSTVFGLLPILNVKPEEAKINLDMHAELYLPSYVETSVAKLFMDPKSEYYQVIDLAPKTLKNPIPPLIFGIDASHTFDLGSRFAIQTGMHVGGNATGGVVNDISLYVNTYAKIPELGTTAYFTMLGRLNGTQTGATLMPGYEITAGTYTKVSDKLQFGLQIYQMGKNLNYGSTYNWGVNFKATYIIGDAPRRLSESKAKQDWKNFEDKNILLYGLPAPKPPEQE